MAYKNCLSELYKIFNTIYSQTNRKFPNKSKEEKIGLTLSFMLDRAKDTNLPSSTKLTGFISYMALNNDILGKSPHYYIEDNEVIQFLEKTKLPPLDNVEKFVYSKFFDKYMRLQGFHEHEGISLASDYKFVKAYVDTLVMDNEGVVYSYNLHTHKEGLSILLIKFYKDNNPGFRVCCITNEHISTLELKDFENIEKQPNLKKEDLTTLRYTKIAINFLFYENTFPECILNRLPKDVSNKKYTGKTVKSSSVVIVPENERKLGISFFRSGCFVTYNDPRYKGARFETRWRKSTIVNGKENKTVVMKEE